MWSFFISIQFLQKLRIIIVLFVPKYLENPSNLGSKFFKYVGLVSLNFSLLRYDNPTNPLRKSIAFSVIMSHRAFSASVFPSNWYFRPKYRKMALVWVILISPIGNCKTIFLKGSNHLPIFLMENIHQDINNRVTSLMRCLT